MNYIFLFILEIHFFFTSEARIHLQSFRIEKICLSDFLSYRTERFRYGIFFLFMRWAVVGFFSLPINYARINDGSENVAVLSQPTRTQHQKKRVFCMCAVRTKGIDQCRSHFDRIYIIKIDALNLVAFPRLEEVYAQLPCSEQTLPYLIFFFLVARPIQRTCCFLLYLDGMMQ